MNYLDFKTAVKEFMTVDGNRIGTTAYVDRMIRSAIRDLQSYITQLRNGQRDIFTFTDLTQDGEASSGSIPEGAMVKDVYYVTKDCPCIQRPFVPYPWDNRFDLMCGSPKISGWQYFMAIDPYGLEFIAYPQVTDTSEIWMYWDGIKADYADTDSTTLGEDEAQAVALYVKSNIAREVDKDLILSESYYTSYKGGPNVMGIRTRLFLDWKRRTQIQPIHDSPQPKTACTFVTCCYSSATVDCGFVQGYFYVKNQTTGKWHRITISGAVGGEQFKIGDPEDTVTFDDCIVSKSTGYSFTGGWFHLLNETTGKFIALAVVGQDGVEQFRFDKQKGTIGNVASPSVGFRLNPCVELRNVERVAELIYHNIIVVDLGGGPVIGIGTGTL